MLSREFAFFLNISYACICTWRDPRLKETGLWGKALSEIIRHLLICNNNTPCLPPKSLH